MLAAGADAVQRGLPPKEVHDITERHPRETPGVKIDYLTLVDPETFVTTDGEAFFADGAVETSFSEGTATMPAGDDRSFPAGGAIMSVGSAEVVSATGVAPVRG